ncbi:hypothetical protein [Helicobacter sp. T3_23-1059]
MILIHTQKSEISAQERCIFSKTAFNDGNANFRNDGLHCHI